MELNNDNLIKDILKTHIQTASKCICFTAILLELRRLLGPKMFLHFLHQHRQKQGQIGSGNGKEKKDNVADSGAPVEIVASGATDPFSESANIYAGNIAQAGMPTSLDRNFQIRNTDSTARDAINNSVRDDVQKIGSAKELIKSMQIVQKLQSDKLAELDANSPLVDNFITELNELTKEGTDLNRFFKQEMEKIKDLLKGKFKVKQASDRVKDRIERAESARITMLKFAGAQTIVTLGACACAGYYYLSVPEEEDCSLRASNWSAFGCYTAKSLNLFNPIPYVKDSLLWMFQNLGIAVFSVSIHHQLQVYLSSQRESFEIIQEMNSNLKEVIRVYEGIIDDNIRTLEVEIISRIHSLQTTNRKLVPALMVYLEGSDKNNIKQQAQFYIELVINRIKLHYISAKLILPKDQAGELSSALSILNSSLNDIKTGEVLHKLQEELSGYSAGNIMTTTREAASNAANHVIELGKEAATAAVTYSGPVGAAATAAIRAVRAVRANPGSSRRTKTRNNSTNKDPNRSKQSGRNRNRNRNRNRSNRSNRGKGNVPKTKTKKNKKIK